MKQIATWNPPGKNCGLCGEEDCRSFLLRVNDGGGKEYADCPYYSPKIGEKVKYSDHPLLAEYGRTDILQHPYDFVLSPLPGEARRARSFYRSGRIWESLKIQTGDYVLGRPMELSPSLYFVVIADLHRCLNYLGGTKTCEREEERCKGLSYVGVQEWPAPEMPSLAAESLLPGFCMMSLNHTGLVNMILEKEDGIHLRLEDIRILAGK